MKKLVTVVLAFFLSLSIFGQKKELKGIEKLIKSKKYNDAEAGLNLIEEQAKGTELESYFYFLYGKNYFGKQNEKYYPEATQFFNKVLVTEKISKTPKYAEKSIGYLKTINKYYLSNIKSSLAKGDYDQVGSLYEAYSNAYPERRDLLVTTLLSYQNAKNEDKTAEITERLLVLDIGDTSYLANNRYTSKEDEFFNKSQRAIVLKNKTHRKPKGVPSEIAIDPETRLNYYNTLVTIYNRQGKNKECLDVLMAAKNEFPYEVKFYEDIETITSKGDNKEAHLTALKDLSTLKPNDRDLWFDLGIVYNELGNKEEAMIAYDKVIAIDPNFSGSYVNKANMIMSDQNKIVDEINNNLNNHKKYAELEEKLKQMYLKAIVQLEKAYSIKPTENIKKILTSMYTTTDQKEKIAAL